MRWRAVENVCSFGLLSDTVSSSVEVSLCLLGVYDDRRRLIEYAVISMITRPVIRILHRSYVETFPSRFSSSPFFPETTLITLRSGAWTITVLCFCQMRWPQGIRPCFSFFVNITPAIESFAVSVHSVVGKKLDFKICHWYVRSNHMKHDLLPPTQGHPLLHMTVSRS